VQATKQPTVPECLKPRDGEDIAFHPPAGF
jgi:hypothetical protein